MSLILLGILNSQAAAAGGAGAYDLLETQVLTSDASSVTFTGLGSYTDYKHLQIRGVSQSSDLSSDSDLWLQFNGITTGYRFHELSGDGSSVSSYSSTFPVVGLNQRNYVNDAFSVHVIDVLDFASSSKNTTVRSFSGSEFQPFGKKIGLYSMFRNYLNAITSLTITTGSYQLRAGSRFSLYGIKG